MKMNVNYIIMGYTTITQRIANDMEKCQVVKRHNAVTGDSLALPRLLRVALWL